MLIRLINLDRTPRRLAEFNTLNGHLSEVSRFPAIDGRALDRSGLAAQGIIGSALGYTDGALGNALSHLTLWDEAIAHDRPVTLCEDDAIFNYNFEQEAESLIHSLPRDWHIIYWGWNFDAGAIFDLIPGVSPFLAMFRQELTRGAINIFQATRVAPRAFRLFSAFGIVSYTISPGGARLLKSLCLPLTNQPIVIPAIDSVFANRDLSVALIGVLRRINAFASFPPLVVTKNDHSISTVLPQMR